MSLALVHPSTILVSGPTGSGKTIFIARLLKHKFLKPWCNKIFWIYSEWQRVYERVKAIYPNITFIHGLPEKLCDLIDRKNRNLLIIDDQMAEGVQSKDLMDLFTKGSHHRNLSIVFIIQNLFQTGPVMRTVSLNTQYIIIFKSPRDKSQVRSLGIQMYPTHSEFLVDTFEDATELPYGYLLIDLRPETPDKIRLRTSILPADRTTWVYLPDKNFRKLKNMKGNRKRNFKLGQTLQNLNWNKGQKQKLSKTEFHKGI